MRKLFMTMLLASALLIAAELSAAVKVYMFPEAVVAGSDVFIGDICKIEGPGSSRYLEIAIPAADYADKIIDRNELERFMKSCFNEKITVFGNGTMITFEPEAESGRSAVKEMAVRRGDSVRVVMSSGNITIRLAGRSLTDGAVNDEIEIRLESGKRIRCVVTGQRQARMI
jgi:flagella basal body P-ring formation protein FlgA